MTAPIRSLARRGDVNLTGLINLGEVSALELQCPDLVFSLRIQGARLVPSAYFPLRNLARKT